VRKGVLVGVAVLLASVAFLVYAGEEKLKTEIDPAAELGASIERGEALFGDPDLGKSGQTCNTCHLEGGTVAGKMGDVDLKAFNALNVRYPKYWAMAKKVMTLDQVVNWCIVGPLKGEALAWDDQRLADLVAYCASVKPVRRSVREKAPETEKAEPKQE
jgi:cytochrome c peroxidase